MIEQGTHIDLFSGIGGFALAARWTGFRTVAFCECEPYAQRVLRKHWPEVPIHDDVRTFPGERYAGATLLTGGFPCQPFSLAGKRAGKEDDRFLWPAMVAVVETVRPAWIIGENVPGIVTMELDRCAADLEEQGYAVWPVIVPACAVGAFHRRDRVWIVAHREKQGLEGTDATRPTCAEGWTSERCGDVADAMCEQRNWWGDGPCRWKREPLEALQDARERGGQEDGMSIPESLLGRVAYGIPARVDRLRGLGNAIVPQVAAELMRMICTANASHHAEADSGRTIA